MDAFINFPVDLWPLVFRFIPFVSIKLNHLYLINRASNEIFIKRFLDSIRDRSFLFTVDDPIPEEDEDDGGSDVEYIPKKKQRRSEDSEVEEDSDEEYEGDEDFLSEEVRNSIYLPFLNEEDDPEVGMLEDISIPSGVSALNEIVKKRVPRWIRRGDAVAFTSQGAGYRNMGKYMWNGTTLVNLDSWSEDDYGIVPKEFKIDQFPTCNYFMSTISHNETIWADLSEFELLKEVLLPSISPEMSYIESKYHLYTIKHKKTGRIWYLIDTEFTQRGLYSAIKSFPHGLSTAGFKPSDTFAAIDTYYKHFC